VRWACAARCCASLILYRVDVIVSFVEAVLSNGEASRRGTAWSKGFSTSRTGHKRLLSPSCLSLGQADGTAVRASVCTRALDECAAAAAAAAAGPWGSWRAVSKPPASTRATTYLLPRRPPSAVPTRAATLHVEHPRPPRPLAHVAIRVQRCQPGRSTASHRTGATSLALRTCFCPRSGETRGAPLRAALTIRQGSTGQVGQSPDTGHHPLRLQTGSAGSAGPEDRDIECPHACPGREARRARCTPRPWARV